MPNCWPAVGASDGCSPEQNRAWQRTPVRSSWVTVICVAVSILHHPVLRVSRVGSAGGPSRPRPVLPGPGGGPDDHGAPRPPGLARAAPPVVFGRQLIGVGVD